MAPHKRTKLGVSRTFQTLRLFLNMTVKENVMAATYCHKRSRVWQSVLRTPFQRREERGVNELAEEKLAFFGERLVGYRLSQPAYSLSYANRRRLEIARAMGAEPRLLLLDEPASGLTAEEKEEVAYWLHEVRGRFGVTLLFVEHDLRFASRLAARMIALDRGEKIAEGTPEEVQRRPEVERAYLGDAA